MVNFYGARFRANGHLEQMTALQTLYFQYYVVGAYVHNKT